MKKHIFFIALLCTLSVTAVERVSLEQLQENWLQYTNKTVQITTPLVVCGNYYDSLVLAPERLVCPEERATGLAEGDSTHYYGIAADNYRMSICVHCRNNYYGVRTGDIVKGLQAKVTGERQLLTGKTIRTQHVRQARLPMKKKGELRVVGANIENYFADLGGYATKNTSVAQQEMKTRKLVSAMRKMDADIFALCEMQQGNKAPQMLLEALNKGGKRYDFVQTDWKDQDRISGCFIYRTDRVKPVGEWMSAYSDTASHYHSRMITQGFEEKASGERFIVSVNHLKSKGQRRHIYDTNAKRMENTDSLLTMLPKAIDRYEDQDVLLLGDYNCYTQEQPIQAIVSAGYDDLLQVYCPNDYSYSYKSQVGYLDRCFASPTMSAQVIRVAPWHVNADWYYSHGAYKMWDKTLHRFSDHEPIVVDIKLQ